MSNSWDQTVQQAAGNRWGDCQPHCNWLVSTCSLIGWGVSVWPRGVCVMRWGQLSCTHNCRIKPAMPYCNRISSLLLEVERKGFGGRQKEDEALKDNKRIWNLTPSFLSLSKAPCKKSRETSSFSSSHWMTNGSNHLQNPNILTHICATCWLLFLQKWWYLRRVFRHSALEEGKVFAVFVVQPFNLKVQVHVIGTLTQAVFLMFWKKTENINPFRCLP